MKYLFFLFLPILYASKAQDTTVHDFEDVLWVCFNCEAQDSIVLGKDTLVLIDYEFARHVSNLNYKATTYPKLRFGADQKLEVGQINKEGALIVFSSGHYKWSYAQQKGETRIVITSNGVSYTYLLRTTAKGLRLIRTDK